MKKMNNHRQRKEMKEDTLKKVSNDAKRKVLVVEDNQLNREMLAEILSDRYQVLTACDGEEGLRCLAEHYQELSVVLLDVCMPVCDGYEFLERIQGDSLLSSIPVIVMTASSRQETELKCLELGAVDFVIKPYNPQIVLGRINSVIKLRESARILAAVEHDELTGLYTRQAFFHHAKTLFKLKKEEDFHVVVADVKDFKLINGSYGATAGDQLLCYMAKAYQGLIRHGLVSRYGSDQFACLVYGQPEIDKDKIETYIREIADHAPIPNVTINYGVYMHIDKTLPVSAICGRGFMAIKNIRGNYESNVSYYTAEMREKQIRSRQLESDFEGAVANREFVVYYQPKYSVGTEKIVGAEALVRWQKPDGEIISPGEFIPVYEKNGQIVKLDEYVFRRVCCYQRRRMLQGKELIPISVNLSRASLHRSGTVMRYVEIVKGAEIPFSCVPIELTETVALYSDRIRRITEALVRTGFLLHMDDFGSGYSSLTSLNELPFSTLKIDKKLIDYIEQPKGKKVVQQVISLAHGLDMKVVAEGVENSEQAQLLKEMTCDVIQGFYYSRPHPEEQFAAMVDQEI